MHIIMCSPNLVFYWEALYVGTAKKPDSQRRDKFYVFLLSPEIGQFSSRFGALSFLHLGAKYCFPRTSRTTPGYPSKNLRTSRQKLISLGFEKHTKSVDPNPFTWKTPTPMEDIRTQNFDFVLLFLERSAKIHWRKFKAQRRKLSGRFQWGLSKWGS